MIPVRQLREDYNSILEVLPADATDAIASLDRRVAALELRRAPAMLPPPPGTAMTSTYPQMGHGPVETRRPTIVVQKTPQGARPEPRADRRRSQRNVSSSDPESSGSHSQLSGSGSVDE